LARALERDWRFFAVLGLGALICGFFWELWNYWSAVRWSYDIPGLNGVPHLFAMPLPGYLGYLPFGLELFTLYQGALLVSGMLSARACGLLRATAQPGRDWRRIGVGQGE
jgi:hypothetical protein